MMFGVVLRVIGSKVEAKLVLVVKPVTHEQFFLDKCH